MTRSGGYTLLEMVVVVALLALATAMVAPAGYRMLASWREAHDVDRLFDSIRALPSTARSEGRQITLGQDEGQDAAQLPPPVALPSGWSVRMSEPLVVRANGACSDAAGTLITARQRLEFRIVSPYCRIERLPAGGG